MAGLWLAWTAAGLFYITQDSVPRLYRGEYVPWKYVFVGWMAGMYVCAALTPALLWLGNRWPVERRVIYAGAPSVLQRRLLDRGDRDRSAIADGAGRLSSGVAAALRCRGPQIMLSFGLQGGAIRYWAVIALQAVYRSHRERQGT